MPIHTRGISGSCFAVIIITIIIVIVIVIVIIIIIKVEIVLVLAIIVHTSGARVHIRPAGEDVRHVPDLRTYVLM